MLTVKSEQNAVTPRRGTARDPILAAAERVIADMGARHMTLDAVAREAGVSKGGLLYHFPSKESLLSAMVERYVECLAQDAPIDDPNADGQSLLNGLIRHRIAARSAQKGDPRMAHAMFAAIVERPALLEPMKAYYDVLWQRIKSSCAKPENAMLAWLALEGLLLFELFNTSPFSEAERERMVGEILELAGGAEPETEKPSQSPRS